VLGNVAEATRAVVGKPNALSARFPGRRLGSTADNRSVPQRTRERIIGSANAGLDAELGQYGNALGKRPRQSGSRAAVNRTASISALPSNSACDALADRRDRDPLDGQVPAEGG
jgi:hypothetical protein